MKRTIRITVMAVMGVSFGIKAQAQAITDTGDKVGIGTTNPTTKLDVHGNIYIQNNENRGSSYFKIFRGKEGRDAATISFGENGNQNWFLGHLYYGGNLSPDLYISKENSIYNSLGTLVHTPEFTIRSNGNVGIGTISPSKRMHIKGSTNSYDQLLLEGGISAAIQLESKDNLGDRPVISANKGNFSIQTWRDRSNWKSTPFYINQYGNVGIGTTSPSKRMHIKGSTGSYDQLLVEGGVSAAIQLESKDNLGDRPVISGNNGSFSIQIWKNRSSWKSTPFHINQSGNIGIGTADTKGFKLGVNGKIAATEVKVATYANWSDFVFYDDYQLPTLKEVENHIKEKGHLKDIPSAKEVEKNGFFLGEMDAKLLQKIEELTLYTIQQEKKIKVLEKQNSKIQELEKLVKKLLEDKK